MTKYGGSGEQLYQSRFRIWHLRKVKLPPCYLAIVSMLVYRIGGISIYSTKQNMVAGFTRHESDTILSVDWIFQRAH